MRASEGLLKAAIGACCDEMLTQYFIEHLIEEEGHLELLDRDLKTLKVERILDFPAAAQLAGAQYYYIEHDHPAMLLGYMLAMESGTPSLEQVAELESRFGPLECVRHHAKHDIGHAAELERQIARLEEPLKTRVEKNAVWTRFDLQTRILPMVQAASNHFARH
jgi:hypothetical protein